MPQQFYSSPSYMSGGNYVVYTGARRQRGGSLFSSFKSSLAPLGKGLARGARFAGSQMLRGAKFAGKNLLSGVKQAAKNEMVRKIAKQAAQKGTEIAVSATVEALQGRNFGEALKEKGREVALDTLTGQNSDDKVMPQGSRKRKRKLKQSKIPSKRARVSSKVTPKAPSKKVHITKKYNKRINSKTNYKRKRKYYKNGRLSRAALNRNNLF